MTEKAFSLTLCFPGAEIDRPSKNPAQSLRPRIGWILPNVDINSDSVRYRCFHFARALSDRFESAYFTSIDVVIANIDTLDVIIVVQRIDRGLTDLAALAQRLCKPMFLDLSTDLMHPQVAGPDLPEIALATLRGIAPMLAGIVVPSATMAERIDNYFAVDPTFSGPCHVVADVAETSEVFSATLQFVTGHFPSGMPLQGRRSAPFPPMGIPAERRQRIVWFGPSGSPQGSAGLYRLTTYMGALRNYHEDVPLELVVVSNSELLFNTLVYECGFPTRFVQWSHLAVYQELQGAAVVLTTSGTDDLSEGEPSNHVVKALACGVPVIAKKSASLAELEEAVLTGKLERSLDICLRPENEKIRSQKMDEARRILTRYTPETLARSWSVLLTRAIGKSQSRKKTARRSGALFVLGPGDRLDEVTAAIKLANKGPEFPIRLLVSTELLQNDLRFANALRLAKSLPQFYSDFSQVTHAGLEQVAYVVCGDLTSNHGTELRERARLAGIAAVEFKDVPRLDLGNWSRAEAPRSTSDRPPPGSFPQRVNPDGSVEWAFVIHGDVRGWILDAICHEIGSRQPAPWKVVGHRSPPPPAKNLFFSHHSLLDHFDRSFPEVFESCKLFAWYTHPRDETDASIARSLDLFSRTTKIVFTCEANRELWVSRGLAAERTAVVLGGADPTLFLGHERGGGCVGLSSSFYERKNPDLLFNVMKALPHRHFTLLGRHWNRYARFEEMLALPNFTYVSAPYHEYPRIYATFDVFLSISKLEGGPIPLIEAMMCNAVPVSSDTGFAPDLITPGENGFLFDVNADAAEVSALIERAFTLTADIRATVLQYSWDNFSEKIMELAR